MGETREPQSHAERYRKRAADLRAMAAKAEQPAVREELEVMARQYDRLADNVQARGAGG